MKSRSCLGLMVAAIFLLAADGFPLYRMWWEDNNDTGTTLDWTTLTPWTWYSTPKLGYWTTDDWTTGDWTSRQWTTEELRSVDIEETHTRGSRNYFGPGDFTTVTGYDDVSNNKLNDSLLAASIVGTILGVAVIALVGVLIIIYMKSVQRPRQSTGQTPIPCSVTGEASIPHNQPTFTAHDVTMHTPSRTSVIGRSGPVDGRIIPIDPLNPTYNIVLYNRSAVAAESGYSSLPSDHNSGIYILASSNSMPRVEHI